MREARGSRRKHWEDAGRAWNVRLGYMMMGPSDKTGLNFQERVGTIWDRPVASTIALMRTEPSWQLGSISPP